MQDKLLNYVVSDADMSATIRKCVDKDMPIAVLRELCHKEVRMGLAAELVDGTYQYDTPHTAYIPKDEIDPVTKKRKMRRVIVHDTITRWLASRTNDGLFKFCADMVHPACTSYQKGMGTGKVVRRVVRAMRRMRMKNPHRIGFKADLSKYFDSVPREVIMQYLDKIDERLGVSVLTTWLRQVYNDDRLRDYREDENGKRIEFETMEYQSLKQGFAVASFLADAVLYHMDERLSALRGVYVRYSDDVMFIGEDAELAMLMMNEELRSVGLTVNEKKVEWISEDTAVKFLGFSIHGEVISLSKGRLDKFVKEVRRRTLDRVRKMQIKRKKHGKPKPTAKEYVNLSRHCVASVNNWLYRGMGGHSWASGCLGVITSEHDVHVMDEFVKDCIRAVAAGVWQHCGVGGIGYVPGRKDGVMERGTGIHMNKARKAMPDMIEGYKSMWALKRAIGDKPQYEYLISQSA